MPLKNFFAGLRALFHKEREDQELDEEVREYIEASAIAKMRAGMDRAQALRAARVELGSVDSVKENVREVGWERVIESLWQDVRYAARRLRKDIGYTATAILALAIGIGANTALFTLFAAVALKPLPAPQPENLVSLWRTTPEQPSHGTFSLADYIYYRDHNSVFAGVAAESPAGLRLSGLPSTTPGSSEPVTALFVSSNYFTTFGVRPLSGRDFFSEEEQLTAGPYPVLLSENYWERRFSRDPKVLGQSLALSGIPATVIGITPRNFMGTRPEVPDLWIIMSARGDLQRRSADRTALCCAITARLKHGATPAQAQAEMSALATSLRRQNLPTERDWKILSEVAAPFGPNHSNILRMFVVLQVAMGLVLLIACTNVAGLLLGKTVSRQREIAVRLSLGATRIRVICQLVTEGIFVSVVAGLIALLITWQFLAAIGRNVSAGLAAQGDTIAIDLTPDFHVFFYALLISIFAGVLFALAPALQSTRPDLVSALKEESAGFGIRKKSRLQAALVAAQIAVCLALLIGAGLLTSTSMRLLALDPGFDTRSVVKMTISSPQGLGSSAVRIAEFQTQFEARLRTLPGVLSVSEASRVPLGGNITSTSVMPQQDSVSSPDGQQVQFPYSYVSKDYFQTLGIKLLRGRTFTDLELNTKAPVVIVSNGLARRYWPEGDALGKHVSLGSPSAVHDIGDRALVLPSAEIVGIASDIYSMDLTRPDPGAVYLPIPSDEWNRFFLVRVTGGSYSAAAALGGEVRAAEPGVNASVETLHETIISGGIAVAFRVSAMIFAAIGLIGFVLASVGIYALVAYSVSQRTHEVGIRMALGARPGDVVWLFLKESSKSIAAGLLFGAGLGVVLSLLLSSRLFLQGARLLDPVVILAISLVTGALAIVAVYSAVRRVTALEPATTLRVD
jgi:predicted permease